VTLNVMPQNLKAAMDIMADVTLNPAFAQRSWTACATSRSTASRWH
jgi:hypothetical protein